MVHCCEFGAPLDEYYDVLFVFTVSESSGRVALVASRGPIIPRSFVPCLSKWDSIAGKVGEIKAASGSLVGLGPTPALVIAAAVGATAPDILFPSADVASLGVGT